MDTTESGFNSFSVHSTDRQLNPEFLFSCETYASWYLIASIKS